MPLEPKIQSFEDNFQNISFKECCMCGVKRPISMFSKAKSPFFRDGYCPVCNSCAATYLRDNDFAWDAVDHLCRIANIPFIPSEVERIRALSNDQSFWGTYAKVFLTQDYESIDWAHYHKQFVRLREVGLIEDELPEIREKKFQELRAKWGENYDDQDLLYLEDLYKGLLVSQNVNGALQVDQAKKLCKISLEIDVRIRNGDKDVDKFLASYDKVVKTAEFTPKNAKNAVDFDSIAELAYWLEKRGFVNKFYDGATRDVVDETIKNIQSWNQRLYINEGGIGEEISQRIEQLKLANENEQNLYETDVEFDLDQYENEAFASLEEEDFKAEDL